MNAQGGGPLRREPPTEQRGLLPERLLLSFNDAAYALGCSRTKVWELVERGALLAVGKGRGRKVLAASVREYVESLVAAERRERGLPPETRCETCGRSRPGLLPAAGRDPKEPTR